MRIILVIGGVDGSRMHAYFGKHEKHNNTQPYQHGKELNSTLKRANIVLDIFSAIAIGPYKNGKLRFNQYSNIVYKIYFKNCRSSPSSFKLLSIGPHPYLSI